MLNTETARGMQRGLFQFLPGEIAPWFDGMLLCRRKIIFRSAVWLRLLERSRSRGEADAQR